MLTFIHYSHSPNLLVINLTKEVFPKSFSLTAKATHSHREKKNYSPFKHYFNILVKVHKVIYIAVNVCGTMNYLCNLSYLTKINASYLLTDFSTFEISSSRSIPFVHLLNLVRKTENIFQLKNGQID